MNYVPACAKCRQPLNQEPHWTNLQLHKRCFDENLRATEILEARAAQKKAKESKCLA